MPIPWWECTETNKDSVDCFRQQKTFFINLSIDPSSAVFAKPLAQLASCFISEERNENCPALHNIVVIKPFALISTSLHIHCSFSAGPQAGTGNLKKGP